MSELKRYDVVDLNESVEMQEFDEGKYCAYADVEALERDAARYRFLRNHSSAITRFVLDQRRESDEWDEEIDAAIAAQRSKL